jgi:predicted nucleotidyltransferase
MTKVVGLIVEYNPLHYGHHYHFTEAKKTTGADAVAIVMSGNFLQRGEPALVNKWARTEMALEMGVDLVFELPYAYSTQQAHYFAFGAVSILNHLPFMTHLCFGSESGDIEDLKAIAHLLVSEPQSFKEKLKQEMSLGKSYPKAYGESLKKLILEQELDPALFEQPNNILGLHYLMSLNKLNSPILPTTIKREKAGYHDKEFSDQKIASATSIRQALFSSSTPHWEKIKPYLPSFTYDILRREAEAGRGPVSWESFYPYIIHSFISQSSTDLHRIYEMEEGIEHRFKAKVMEAETVEHLCQLVKSKRYTWNRIQRMMLHTYTQFSKHEAQELNLDQGPTYMRLLGYSDKGQQLLNQHKKELEIPLISSIRKDHPPMLDWDLKAASLHTLGYRIEAALQEKKREVLQQPLSKNKGKRD